jgi:hypothetical protein
MTASEYGYASAETREDYISFPLCALTFDEFMLDIFEHRALSLLLVRKFCPRRAQNIPGGRFRTDRLAGFRNRIISFGGKFKDGSSISSASPFPARGPKKPRK